MAILSRKWECYPKKICRRRRFNGYQTSPRSGSRRPKLSTATVGFFEGGHADPAWYVRLKLMRAGDVHPNPGPVATKWPCFQCGQSAQYGSVQCIRSRCRKWFHRRCTNIAQLSDAEVGRVEARGIVRLNWTCPECNGEPNADAARNGEMPAAIQADGAPPPRFRPSRKQRKKFRRRRFHIPDDPPPAYRKKKSVKNDAQFVVLQWNCAGVRSKMAQLNKLIHDNNPAVVCLQETNLDEKASFRAPQGYNVIRQHRKIDRAGEVNEAGYSHGGVMMLIHEDYNYERITTGVVAAGDNSTEYVAAVLNIPGCRPTRFVNVYVPPIRNAAEDAREDNFDPSTIVCTRNTFVAGDFNAHTKMWCNGQPEDARGKKIEEWAELTDMVTANTGISTKSTTDSAPDITFHHASSTGSVNWCVLEDHNSDHLPIRFAFEAGTPKSRRAPGKWCYHKAEWSRFREITNASLTEVLTCDSAFAAWKVFKGRTLSGAGETIKQGRKLKPKVWWCDRAEEMVKERKDLRERAKTDDAVKAEFNRINRESSAEIRRLKAESWREFATVKLNPRTDPSLVFKTLKKIEEGTSTAHPATPLERGGRKLVTDAAKSSGFCTEYRGVSKLEIPKEELREKRKVIKSLNGECSNCVQGDEDEREGPDACCVFSKTELNRALTKLKTGKAPGEDGITNEMLKQLGEGGKDALLHLCNLSWKNCEVPMDWRKATIIPLLKTGKPAEKLGSYRPVSLTSHVAKLMERLVQARLSYILEKDQLLNKRQSGFRPLRSTEDQCLRISQQVSDGFNELPPKKTVMVLVDFKRAFDTVWKLGLYEKMISLGLPKCYVKWVRQFLSDRCSRVSYGCAKSKYMQFQEGVPQGCVLSPTLFLCFINDITERMPEGVTVSLFADDLAMWAQNTDTDAAEALLQQALDVLDDWSKTWKLQISVEKTETAFFSNDSKDAQYKPWLSLRGERLGHNIHPKFLGVTFDRQLTFTKHIELISAKMKKKANVLKAVKGKNWGCDKDDLRTIYLTFVRSAADYCASAWGPSASKTQIRKLDVAQNMSARAITSCTSSTPIDSLLIEANLMPVEDRVEELSAVAMEKSLRLPEDNPRRHLAEMEVKTRLKRGNWRSKADKTLKECKLEGFPREDMVPTQSFAPWTLVNEAEFYTQTLRPIKKSDPDEVKREAAEETIDSYKNADLNIYTDGSVKESIRDGGGGAVIFDRWNRSLAVLKAPAGALSCSYRAELKAINIALQKVFDLQTEMKLQPGARVNFFTDSKSAVDKLSGGEGRDELVVSTYQLIESIARRGNKKIIFQWIPSHCGVAGNELADEYAGQASNLEQTAAPVDMSTAKAVIARHIAAKWKAKAKPKLPGACFVGRDKEPNMKREERTLLARMRTGGYTPELAWYRNFITRNQEEPESAACHRCGEESETAMHVLLECPVLEGARQRRFEGSNPVSQLFENPSAAVNFLRDAGLFEAGRI